MTLDCEKSSKRTTVKGHFFCVSQGMKKERPEAAPTYSVYQMDAGVVNNELYNLNMFSVLYK